MILAGKIIDLDGILLFISASASAVAAVAAFQTAKTTRDTIHAQIFLQFMNDYGKQEMSESLRTLVKWHEDYGEQFATQWLKALGENDNNAKDVDKARRYVSSYFINALGLLDAGLIPQHLLKRIAHVDGIAVWYKIVQPLEAVLNPNYDKKVFEKLSRFFPED